MRCGHTTSTEVTWILISSVPSLLGGKYATRLLLRRQPRVFDISGFPGAIYEHKYQHASCTNALSKRVQTYVELLKKTLWIITTRVCVLT